MRVASEGLLQCSAGGGWDRRTDCDSCTTCQAGFQAVKVHKVSYSVIQLLNYLQQKNKVNNNIPQLDPTTHRKFLLASPDTIDLRVRESQLDVE